jgi:uncharacterized protein DUF6932
MALPAWDESGLLPPGIHQAGLPDLYERFVLDAPARERRELLFGALSTHLRLIQAIVPAGRAWIDGSFCTRTARPPHDVDVVLHPGDWKALEGAPPATRLSLGGLITLQGVVVTVPPAEYDRLQPMGGTIDAFVCYPSHERIWRERWAKVTDPDGNVVTGKVKGFAEVAW